MPMGGDFCTGNYRKGAMDAVQEFPDLELVLYGDEAIIKTYLTNSGTDYYCSCAKDD